MTDNHHKGPPNSPPNLPVALQFPTRWCPTPHLLLPHRLSPLLSQSLHSLSTCPYQNDNSFKHSHSCKFSRHPQTHTLIRSRWHHFQQTKYQHYSNNPRTSLTYSQVTPDHQTHGQNHYPELRHLPNPHLRTLSTFHIFVVTLTTLNPYTSSPSFSPPQPLPPPQPPPEPPPWPYHPTPLRQNNRITDYFRSTKQ